MVHIGHIRIPDDGKSQDRFRKAQELTSLVLVATASVNVFKGRWRVISKMLQELSMSLSSVADSTSSSRHIVLLEDILQNIVSTLAEGKALSERCTNLNYGGKLLMQSNLDAIAAKLHLHLWDIEILIKSEALRETAALANSHRETSIESNIEAETLYVWELFARLKIGNTGSKTIALESLIDYLKQKEKVALVVEEGNIPYLIRLLDSSLPVIRERAVHAVSILAQADICRQSSIIENAHAPLIRLLETGTSMAKEKAVEALFALSYIREHAYTIAALGGVSALVEICANGTPGQRAMAAGTIRNLASNEEIRKSIAEECAIPILVNLITCGTHLAQDYAAEALQNLASGDNKFRLVIAQHGGLQTLLMCLYRSTSPKAQEIAISALCNLSACVINAKVLISAGYLSQLATILKTGTSSVQQLVVSTIYNLSASGDIRKALGEAGCIPPVALMLEDKNTIEEEKAAPSNILPQDNDRKEFCKEEKGISRVLQLLDPRKYKVAKRSSMPALLALSSSSNWGKRVLSAGARQHLEILTEMDVAGGKKTLTKIGGNKMRNIFTWFKS